jgi:hypothetical protein
MKIIRILPQWLGVKGMAIWPFILSTKTAKLSEVDINHERIHLRQQLEMLVLPFYILYFLEYGIKSLIKGKDAYYDISFEREAYANDKNKEYLKERKFCSWFKYL